MNFKFLVEMFSGESGVSAKRGTLLWSVIVFTFLITVNVFTGKQPSPFWCDLLDQLLKLSLAAVFGEPVIKAYAEYLKNKGSNKQT